MHISGHCLLKTFIFPYLNMLMFFPLWFRATWHPLHPAAAQSWFLSISLFLSLVNRNKKKKHVKWPWFLPTGLLLCERVAIFALPGDYTFLQGLPSLLKHSPLREQRTHICTQNHTQGHLLKLLQYLAGSPWRRTVHFRWNNFFTF